MISKELLSDIIGKKVFKIATYYKKGRPYELEIYYTSIRALSEYINIYELAHNHLKKWAKDNNIFDMIDWSETPEQIFKRADELRNATRQYI